MIFSSTNSAITIIQPQKQNVPFVFTSPHSGRAYTPDFLQQAAIPLQKLRTTEDCYIDQLYECVPQLGAPLLLAQFPRSYVDVNRAADELDPLLLTGTLPNSAYNPSIRARSGYGVIPRVVADGTAIYAHKITLAEAEQRLRTCYLPYHQALQNLIRSTKQQFGFCIVLDCHSMPSIGGPMDKDPGEKRVDFVLGDCFSTSCAPSITHAIENSLIKSGYHVAHNRPYAGAFTTKHYGKPALNVHVLQIEICRSLYIKENTFEKTLHFATLQSNLQQMIASLFEQAFTLITPDALAAE